LEEKTFVGIAHGIPGFFSGHCRVGGKKTGSLANFSGLWKTGSRDSGAQTPKERQKNTEVGTGQSHPAVVYLT
jgi:hypothetical protein